MDVVCSTTGAGGRDVAHSKCACCCAALMARRTVSTASSRCTARAARSVPPAVELAAMLLAQPYVANAKAVAFLVGAHGGSLREIAKYACALPGAF